MGQCSPQTDLEKISILSIIDNDIRSDLQVEVDVYKYPKHDFIIRQNKEVIDGNNQKKKRYMRFDVDETEFVQLAFPVFSYLSQSLASQLGNFQIVEVLLDEINMDKCLYLVKRNQKMFSLMIRKFNSFSDDHSYQVANQIFTYHKIALLDTPYLHKISHSYNIEPINQLISNYSQLILMDPVTTNLSLIIKNRRSKLLAWTIRQFVDFMKQLVEGVSIMHKNWLTHNDIRPSNVYYMEQTNTFCLGSFSSVKVKLEGSPPEMRKRKRSVYYQQTSRNSGKKGGLIDHQDLIDLYKDDVYALGMTFLSAFYLFQPIDRKKCAPFSRELSQNYPILLIIKGMLMNQQKRFTITEVKDRLNQFEQTLGKASITLIGPQIQLLQINHTEKYKRQISIADGYKTLGIIKSWREKLNDRNLHQKISQQSLQSAKHFGQLALISKMEGNLQKCKSYYMRSAQIYHLIGTNNFKERDYNKAIFYFQKSVQCINLIKLEKSNIQYMIMNLSLKEAKIISGLALTSLQRLQQLYGMLNQFQNINFSTYCHCLQQFVDIYSYYEDYNKTDKLLKILLQKSQKTKSPKIYIEIQTQIIQNNIKIAALKSKDNQSDNAVLIASTQQKIARITNELQYYLIEHPLYKMQISFLHAKLNMIKKADSQLIIYKVQSQIRDWIEHFSKLNMDQNSYQFYLLHAKVLEEIGDQQQKKNNHQISFKYYTEAFRVYRIYFGNMYNIECALVTEKIGNVYKKTDRENQYWDCIQVLSKIINSTYGRYHKHVLRLNAEKLLIKFEQRNQSARYKDFVKFDQWQGQSSSEAL